MQAMLDAFLILLNVAAFVGYGTIPLDVFFPQRSLLTDWLPPGEPFCPAGRAKPDGNAVDGIKRSSGVVVGEPSIALEEREQARYVVMHY